ncbi:metallophosphoesterase [Anaerobacillus sp. CMMVII]|uniref:metallophosphoesterase family protein n=1 Tax=Anaerobacillus sp. CMMVII TaxID=2755588 RepID=UPI0021B7AAAA|nr:metallophosphoesterase [Anaerobacillus sp. CMMVII]MCT8137467.1 metallophosphoesterase [Anaerobacillus sp. CMMVII]
MKLLIISDSHGLQDELFGVFDRHAKEVDKIIHCGDSELSKDAFISYDNLLIVRGNCDYDASFNDEINTDVMGLKIFLVHGHLHNVKSSAVNLSYRAEELNAKLVCYGHTHVAISFQENGIIYINPGSFRLPRKRIERSYAILNYQQDEATVNYYDHLGKEILDLKNSFVLL